MKPFIFNFATTRRDNLNEKIYEYHNNLNLNVLKSNENEEIPFVEMNTYKIELQTKTAVKRDVNEEEMHNLFELETRTSTQKEGVNEVNYDMLELVTKTNQQTERDDDLNSNFLELSTKTEIQRERDDEGYELNTDTFTKIKSESNDEDDFIHYQ